MTVPGAWTKKVNFIIEMHTLTLKISQHFLNALRTIMATLS